MGMFQRPPPVAGSLSLSWSYRQKNPCCWDSRLVCVFSAMATAATTLNNDDEGSYMLVSVDEPDLEALQQAGDGYLDIHEMSSWKSSSGNWIWRTCLFILGTELFEQLAFFAIEQNLVTYLTSQFHFANAAAARTVTSWTGTCSLAPLLGALLADTFWGRYKTIAVFSAIYFAGMIALTLSVSISALRPASTSCIHDDGICSEEASTLKHGLFFCALYLIALGEGSIKPCVPAFGADQFDDTVPEERKMKVSFFNWFYFSINMGPAFSSTLVVWVQDNVGWGWGYGISTTFMALAVIIFFCGTPLYKFQKPGGSPLARMCHVLVASLGNCHKQIPEDDSLLHEVEDKHSSIQGSRKLEHTNDFRCLDKAAIVTQEHASMLGSHPNSWKLCTVTQVEEMKILLRLFPIWIAGIMFSSVCAQMSTVFVEQGMVMDTKIGSFTIPAASMFLFNLLTCIVWVPIYDRIIVPVAHKYTGNERGFTQLQQIGIGLGISVLAMIAAAVAETVRLGIARHENLTHDAVSVPMSVFWQIPQYSLLGVADAFKFTGELDFFYEQAPDAMRSTGTALPYLSNAAGNYLSSLIVTIVTTVSSSKVGKGGWIPDKLNEGHLDYYFWLLAALSLLNLLAFITCARNYKHKKVR